MLCAIEPISVWIEILAIHDAKCAYNWATRELSNELTLLRNVSISCNSASSNNKLCDLPLILNEYSLISFYAADET